MSTQSVKTALQVLEAVSSEQPVGLSELARTLGMNKSTVQRCLVTLAEAGWIRTVGEDRPRWTMTTKAFSVGARVEQVRTLRELALPILNGLQEYTRETIHLGVPDDRSMVLIERLDSSHPVRVFRQLGSRAPMHATANGQAYLAAQSEEFVDAYVADGLPAVAARTITDPAVFRDELDRIRERGYAVNDEGMEDGVVAVAAAIVTRRSESVGSFSVSAPKVRMSPESIVDYGERAVEAAQRISAHLRDA